MRLPASEKLEIIHLVEQSHLPARRPLDMLPIHQSANVTKSALTPAKSSLFVLIMSSTITSLQFSGKRLLRADGSRFSYIR